MKAGPMPGVRAALFVLALLFAGCAPPPERSADTIYIGGTNVTVNDKQPSAEALAIKDIGIMETIKEGKTIYKRP